ncbi:MAG TPA: hypothetical protein VJB56_03270 [Candidatus Paceibacterota bacterium]
MRKLMVIFIAWVVIIVVALIATKTDASEVVIFDSLGNTFSETGFEIGVYGTSGRGVSAEWHVGVEVMLTKPTMITEVGGIMNNCGRIEGGVALCPGALPFVVEVRPARDGFPDHDEVIANLALTDDGDPLRYSYERWRGRLHLRAGKYFFLVAPARAEDSGSILSTACRLNNIGWCETVYEAERVHIWSLNTATGTSQTDYAPAGFRVLGFPKRGPAK